MLTKKITSLLILDDNSFSLARNDRTGINVESKHMIDYREPTNTQRNTIEHARACDKQATAHTHGHHTIGQNDPLA